MSGPDFEGVLAAHREDPAYHDTCVCETSIADDVEVDGHYAAHLSAALHAELTRWLGDEGTERVVARQVYDFTDEPMWSAVVVARHATAALAALTTTDQEEHR